MSTVERVSPSEPGGNLPPGELLRTAADSIDAARSLAQQRGDPDQAARLADLTNAVEHEREYAANVDRGMPVVRRRTDAPAGAALGWFLRDPAVRAARRARRVADVATRKRPTISAGRSLLSSTGSDDSATCNSNHRARGP